MKRIGTNLCGQMSRAKRAMNLQSGGSAVRHLQIEAQAQWPRCVEPPKSLEDRNANLKKSDLTWTKTPILYLRHNIPGRHPNLPSRPQDYCAPLANDYCTVRISPIAGPTV